MVLVSPSNRGCALGPSLGISGDILSGEPDNRRHRCHLSVSPSRCPLDPFSTFEVLAQEAATACAVLDHRNTHTHTHTHTHTDGDNMLLKNIGFPQEFSL